MRVRVSFEAGAGVCLWADDAEARERWCSAVEFQDLPLPEELAQEGRALMAELAAAYGASEDPSALGWSDDQAAAFDGRASKWRDAITLALKGADIEVAEYGASPEQEEGPEFEGCVMVCFSSIDARVEAERREYASFAWEETATWNGDLFKYRADERSPAEFLMKMGSASGFVCGWWQAREGGAGAMLEGDPVEHAVRCVRERNFTGLANYLSWLNVQRVHLGDELLHLDWSPSPQHKLGDEKGSLWEWFDFLRNAQAALKGKNPSARYLRKERDRLLWKWTHGGSQAGWPRSAGEALERIGLLRESHASWSRVARG